MKSKLKNIMFIIILLVVLVLIISICYGVYKVISNSNVDEVDLPLDSNFKYNMIRQVNNDYKDTNYLISPYSIEVALSMVREGAGSSTLEELTDVVPKRKIEDIRIKNRINVANALFIKSTYSNDIKTDYKNKIKKDYNSKLLIDKFETPKVINNWVNKETDKMIDKVIDEIDPDFVMGIANALALDVEWKQSFECNRTYKEKFISNGKSFDVVMMNNSFRSEASYFDTQNEEGIILPYNYYNKKTGRVSNDEKSELEFIGIIPKSNISTYINSFDNNVLNNIINNKKEASSDLTINLKLPRFSYSFDYSDFMDGLKEMGLNEMFSANADFSEISNMDLYINKAVHKTYIDLNEKGTKAAAVTYFSFTKNAIEIDENAVDITFNKPFIYMIKYKDEIVFFGVVYEPEKWTNKTITCSK